MRISLSLVALMLATSAFAEESPGAARHQPSEQIAPMKAVTKAQALERFEKQFGKADTNNDEILTPEERRAAIKRAHAERRGSKERREGAHFKQMKRQAGEQALQEPGKKRPQAPSRDKPPPH